MARLTLRGLLTGLVARRGGMSIVAPTITSSGSLAAAEVGIPQTWAALEADDGGGTVTWSIESGAPTGLSINSATGILSYDGSLTTNQTYDSLVVRATNAAGYDEATFSLVMAYTPKNEGFAHWQRADQSRAAVAGTGSAPADTEPIGWLADLIAGTNPCRAEDDGGKPTYIASAINGKPALSYDGTTDRMKFDADWTAGTDDYFFFIIARGGNQNWNTFLGGSTVDGSHYAVIGQNSNIRMQLRDNNNAGNIYSTGTFTNNVFYAIRVWRNGSSFYVKVGSSSYGPFTVGAADQTFHWLGFIAQNTGYMHGKIAEWGHLGSTPDAAALARIEGYINTRYGLAV